MEDSVLSSEVKSQDYLRIFDEMAALRFASIELEKILIYMFDTVDVKALSFLAEQFDLLGIKGWNAAVTEQQKRDLLKQAIELHRYKGTIYAIRRAVQSVGYYDIIIVEGAEPTYDGEFNYDGFINYGGGNWANFRVTLDIGNSKGINTVETAEAIALINEYKNARSKLVSVAYTATVIDNMDQITDEITLNVLDSSSVLIQQYVF
jgi:phage tail P2-like protein